jgi:hypothetical protein
MRTKQEFSLLQKAVETAPKMIMALRQLGRPDGRNLYYKDRQYENVWSDGTSEWLQDGYLDVNQRAAYFQIAYSSAPAMVMRTLGAGSKYPVALRDANGEFLNGSNTYKLRLPPNPPAALFWAVTAYNITDGTMVEAPQLMPSINGFNKVSTNGDGSIDLWFGPQKPADAPQSNWIQTVDGRNFLVALRLYGTGVEFFDQTWKPDDVVRPADDGIYGYSGPGSARSASACSSAWCARTKSSAPTMPAKATAPSAIPTGRVTCITALPKK